MGPGSPHSTGPSQILAPFSIRTRPMTLPVEATKTSLSISKTYFPDGSTGAIASPPPGGVGMARERHIVSVLRSGPHAGIRVRGRPPNRQRDTSLVHVSYLVPVT